MKNKLAWSARLMLLAAAGMFYFSLSNPKPSEAFHYSKGNLTKIKKGYKNRSLRIFVKGEEGLTLDTNLVYQDFNDIDFNKLPKRKTLLHPILKKAVFSPFYRPKIRDKKKLEGIVFTEAKKRGYDKEELKSLSPKKALDLSIDIVTERIDYHLVDNDPIFIKKHGFHLPIEDYFEIGKGDCDKYCSGLTAVFETMKKVNPALQNIYIMREALGGMSYKHAWNCILIPSKEKTIISHIDLTSYDAKGPLEAKKGTHIPGNRLEFLADVTAELGDKEASYFYLDKLYSILSYDKSKEKVLKKMAFLACHLDDKDKMDETRKRYINQPSREHHDIILYYSFRVEYSHKNHAQAEKFLGKLVEKYPHSFWIKLFAVRNQHMINIRPAP